jgi:hypothetical protein
LFSVIKWLVVLPLLASVATEAVGEKGVSRIQYHMKSSIASVALREAEPLQVKASLRLPRKKSELCFYLAYNDPLYFHDPTQSLEQVESFETVNRPDVGTITLREGAAALEQLSPYLIRWQADEPRSELAFEFTFVIPRWADRLGNQFLFHQFYPQPLETCPSSEQPVYNYPLERDVSYQMELNWPRSWQLTTPGRFIDTNVLSARGELSFNLTHNYRLTSFQLGQLTVQLAYISDSFRDLELYARNFLVSLQRLLGPFPYDKLLILETEDLERARIAGAITLNRPKQSGMQSLQTNLLNWTSWQLAFSLAEQWLGTSLAPQDFDDYWFFRGTAEYAASEALSREPSVRNLFSSDDLQDPWLQLTYRQGTDLAASLLSVLKTEQQLVIPGTLQTKEAYLTQHSFSYVRHVLALRYLHWLYGDDFHASLQQFVQKNLGQRITHRDFLTFLQRQSQLSRNGVSAGSLLRQWWTATSLPDFTLEDQTLTPPVPPAENWELTVKITQNPDLVLPVDVVVVSESGARHKKLVFPDDATSEVQLTLAEQPDRVELNPGREIYDRDRFDNSNSGFSLSFFPGNAKTLKDDEYTMVWFPFPSLLPGEPLSLNLGLQVFRYVTAGVSGVINYIPERQQVGYNLLYLTDLPAWDSFLTLNLLQNYGSGLKDARIAGVSVNHSVLSGQPRWNVGLSLNARETIGRSVSRHLIGGVNTELRVGQGRTCQSSFQLNRQSTLGIQSTFSYSRDWSVANLNCARDGTTLGLRFFAGSLRSTGPIAKNIQFHPQNLDEARLRIDQPNLTPTQKLQTVGLDIAWPARLPIPAAFFVLPRKAKWRLSYDYGESWNERGIYSDVGLGISLPLGGDVVGKRSLAFFKFTALAIVHRRHPGEVSETPGILFDFLGKL